MATNRCVICICIVQNPAASPDIINLLSGITAQLSVPGPSAHTAVPQYERSQSVDVLPKTELHQHSGLTSDPSGLGVLSAFLYVLSITSSASSSSSSSSFIYLSFLEYSKVNSNTHLITSDWGIWSLLKKYNIHFTYL